MALSPVYEAAIYGRKEEQIEYHKLLTKAVWPFGARRRTDCWWCVHEFQIFSYEVKT
ncbi:MAG TPA: hypothetical protein VN841_26595 [Bryobacteraceae bacterium]|nr:hypothetical protein [Bryobacteraceae bacterium]